MPEIAREARRGRNSKNDQPFFNMKKKTRKAESSSGNHALVFPLFVFLLFLASLPGERRLLSSIRRQSTNVVGTWPVSLLLLLLLPLLIFSSSLPPRLRLSSRHADRRAGQGLPALLAPMCLPQFETREGSSESSLRHPQGKSPQARRGRPRLALSHATGTAELRPLFLSRMRDRQSPPQ